MPTKDKKNVLKSWSVSYLNLHENTKWISVFSMHICWTLDWVTYICQLLSYHTGLDYVKTREFQKNIYLGFNNYTKAFDCVDHNNLWKARKEMGIPDHLTCLLRNLHAGQEATARTLYGTSDWFKTEKGIWQGVILSPCLFNLYTEHITRNAGLDELQAGSKTSRRNNSLTCAYDTTLMAENEDELNSLLMRVKEENESLRLKVKA